MNLRSLERRVEPRTSAFTPITLQIEGHPHETPAHLLDLSATGAAILTTAHNAPQIGERLNVHFETPNNDGGSEGRYRIETGIVVNCSATERGVRRLGIRFFNTPELGSGLVDPIDLLSSHRKAKDQTGHGGRWQTARNFREPVGVGPAKPQTVQYPW